MKNLVLSLIILAGLAPLPAMAGVKVYSQPKLEGVPVSACLAGSGGCGKVAADAFCRKEGLGESILFTRQAAAQTLVIDSGKTCAGDTCQALTRVKCLLPPQQAAGTSPATAG
ncbi:MAG: hypothetical protein U1E15_04870 [Hyphomicrobiales bacterium]